MLEEPAETGSPLSNRRFLGRTLLHLRNQTRLTRAQVAASTDVSSSTLGRIENGELGVKIRQGDLRDLLELYKASVADKELVLGLGTAIRNSATAPWWIDQLQGIPDWFTERVALEEAAQQIREYAAENVIGLLQTEAYARSLIYLATGGDQKKTDAKVKIRMDRQKLLDQPQPPKLEVILNESVLHRIAGSGDPARDQLQHLLDVTQRSNVTLALLPYSAGIHGGMAAAGGFSILNFPVDSITKEPREPTYVYFDSLTGSMSFTKDIEVQAYDRAWQDMASKAENPEATRLAITKLLNGLH